MKTLSNGNGAVGLEGDTAWAIKGGFIIGCLKIPMSLDDALLLMEMALSGNPGDGTFEVGVTGSYTLAELMGIPRSALPQKYREDRHDRERGSD